MLGSRYLAGRPPQLNGEQPCYLWRDSGKAFSLQRVGLRKAKPLGRVED